MTRCGIRNLPEEIRKLCLMPEADLIRIVRAIRFEDPQVMLNKLKRLARRNWNLCKGMPIEVLLVKLNA